MKIIKCDGCDRTENFVKDRMPDSFKEVSVSVSTTVAEGVHLKTDLCVNCEAYLRDQMDPRRWARAGGA